MLISIRIMSIANIHFIPLIFVTKSTFNDLFRMSRGEDITTVSTNVKFKGVAFLNYRNKLWE